MIVAAPVPLPHQPTIHLTPSVLPNDLIVPNYDRALQPFHAGETLLYQASWLGIPAATVQISFSQNGTDAPCWIGQMWLATNRFIDHFYRMRDYAREDFPVRSGHPARIYVEQRENQRHDRWYVSFNDDRHRVTAVRENREGKSWIRVFDGGDPLGPFSGSMWALSQRLEPGNTFTFDVFCGGSRYVIALSVLARQKISTPQGSFDTLRIEPSILWTSDSNLLGRAKRLTLWVSDDDHHIPVRVEAAVFIGSVRLDLTKLTGVRP